MKGMNAGGVELPEEEQQRKRLIAAITDSPTEDRLYRKWMRINDKTGESLMDSVKFDDLVEQDFNKEQLKPSEAMEKFPQPFLGKNDVNLEYKKAWAPELLTAKDRKTLASIKAKLKGTPKFKPSAPILIKKDKNNGD